MIFGDLSFAKVFLPIALQQILKNSKSVWVKGAVRSSCFVEWCPAAVDMHIFVCVYSAEYCNCTECYLRMIVFVDAGAFLVSV